MPYRSRQTVPQLLFMAAAGGLIAYEVLFSELVWGINVALLYGYFLAVLLLGRYHGRARRAARLPLSVCVLGAGALAIEPTVLSNLLAWPALFVLALQLRKPAPVLVGSQLSRLAGAFRMFPQLLVRDSQVIRMRAPLLRQSVRYAARMARQWALIALALLPFLVLFSCSNPLTAEALGGLQRWVGDGVQRLFSRVILDGQLVGWCLVGLISWSLFRLRGRGATYRRQARPGRQLIQPDPQQLVRFLVASNAVFLSQNILDAVYLIGHRGVLPPGFTFAEYAHRGAYPLVATVLLAAAFILYLFHPRGAAVTQRLPRLLVEFWLLQNLLLLISAAYRLHLYVEVYQLTRFRYATFLWMGAVAAGLCHTGIRIAKSFSNRWLIEGNLCVVLLLLFYVATVDIDGAIAWHNVEQKVSGRVQGQVFDLGYALSLAPNSLPALQYYRRCSSA